MVDGSTLVLGLLLGMVISAQSDMALWHAALGGGLAELGGMSLGQYWADPEAGKVSAAMNGIGCCLTTIVCGLPFLLTSYRPAATVASAALIVFAAELIYLLRDETGWVAFLRTFGLLVLVGVLSGASGLI